MSEPICKCGHRKTWHRDQGGACIHPIGVHDSANDCDCKGYALPEPTPTLRDQFAMALGPVILSYIFEMRTGPSECSAVAEGLWNQIDAIMAAREKKS